MVRVTRNLGIIVLILSVIGLGIGTAFIVEGIAKSKVITEAMKIEQASYKGNEAIVGIIDTPAEAQAMAETLREHRLEIGLYTELPRDDPKRGTILNAMTIENALNLAQLGYGVTTVVTFTGVFMVIMGFALGGTGIGLYRLGGRTA